MRLPPGAPDPWPCTPAPSSPLHSLHFGCLRSQCPADNGGFGLCHWHGCQLPGSTGKEKLPRAPEAARCFEQAGLRESLRDQKQKRGIKRGRRTLGAVSSLPPSPKTPRRKGKLGVGVSLPHLSLHLAMCAAIEGPAGWADYPKGEGCGSACPHTWAGSIDVAASTV